MFRRALVQVGRAVLHQRQVYCCQSRLGSTTSIASLLYPSDRSPKVASDSSVSVSGFVRSVRKQKNVAFVALGDGTTSSSLQVVLSPDLVQGLNTGASVKFEGEWKASRGGKQSHELHATKVNLIGDSDENYPLQKKFHGTEFLRSIPHLRTRLPQNALLLRLRSLVIQSLTNFFSEQEFVQVHPPVLTSSDCEGAGEVFTVVPASSPRERFFKSSKYLTVSTQLHLEALAQSVDKVWTLSPTFRAEKSDTPRHLSEFYMLEAEVAFTDNLASVMDLTENMLMSVGSSLLASRVGEELSSAASGSDNELRTRWERLALGGWPRISYADAVQQIRAAADAGRADFRVIPNWGDGLQAEHEKWIAETVGNNGPVFITDYPRDIKAFYMPINKQNGEQKPTVSCFDLVVPEVCEIIGGSMREWKLERLLENMKHHGMLTQDDSVPISLQWYADLRKWGSVPHGGFGLGFDRLLCYLSGVSSIRDMVTFPRYYGRCDC